MGWKERKTKKNITYIYLYFDICWVHTIGSLFCSFFKNLSTIYVLYKENKLLRGAKQAPEFGTLFSFKTLVTC